MNHYLNLDRIGYFILICTIGGIMVSCGSVKHHQIMMFEEIENEMTQVDSHPALLITEDDILSIQVSSRNPINVAAFQQKIDAPTGYAGEEAFALQEGYRVDKKGFIYLPFLGSVKAVNKTIVQLHEEISHDLKAYIPDASVQLRFLNFRVTLLGEVTRPNTYTIPNERLTILEALGMAGDFTPYARRNAILVVRERGGDREFVRLNMQRKSLFESPYFYLKPNDIVYVEPLKAKKYATSGDFLQRYAPIVYPLVTLLTTIITINATK
jgi:polysaccharide export outer membrane protein